MRWPWERVPWGRTRGVDDPAAGDAGTVPDAADPTPAHAASSGTGLPAAWTRLPPLQRSVADTTAVAPPTVFRSSLTTHQNPSLLAPLGHLVDPDGPAGVVGGLASSVGGPIPYEGVDELRVPERLAKPTAPAVQRRIATLQSMAAPAPAAPQRIPAEPEFLPEAPPVVSTPVDGTDNGSPDSGSTETGPTEIGPADLGVTADGSMTPAPPAPLPSVVQRSASDTTHPTPGAREAPTIATPDPAGTQDRPAPISSEAPSGPPPLTVPVQRSATSTPESTSDVRRPVGDAAPPTAQAIVSPPADYDALVVARSVAEPSPLGAGVVGPAPPSGDEVVGLVADRSPLLPPSSSESPSPSESPSSSDESTPPPARTDLAAPLTVATSSVATPPIPAVQRLGPAPHAAGQRSADVTTTGVLPPAPPPVSPPRPPAGLDEQGYPPLIARSVQRTPVSGHPATTSPSSRLPDPTTLHAPPPASEVLSPFGTAITALQADSADAGGDTVTASVGYGAAREPDLVVARRLAPDGAGELPPATGHLQPDSSLLEGHREHGPEPVQRSLIGGRPPVPSALDTLPTGTTIPTAPAVQRLRYDSATTTGGRRVDGPAGLPWPPGASQVDVATGPDPAPAPVAPRGESSRPVAVTGPSSSGSGSWSVQRQSAGSGTGAVAPALAAARGDRPAAVELPSSVSSVPFGLGSTAPATPGFPATSLASAPPASAAPATPVSRSAELPLVQRRFDAAAAGSAGAAPLAPPASTDPPAMAVSSRTVGLAEMFALAAAQSADGVAVQRSGEPEVQTASVDAAPTPSAASSSAPAAPTATPAPTATLSAAELAEMARRLYEPLAARLRNELWQDRERAGLLTDLRP